MRRRIGGKALAGATVVAAVALSAGCGGSSSASTTATAAGVDSTGTVTQAATTPTSYRTARAIVAALAAAGHPCTGATYGVTGTQIGPKPIDEATCNLPGGSTTINIYSDPGALQNAEGLAKTFGCAFGKAMGLVHFYFVPGDVWEVTPSTETDDKAVAAALGGKPVTINCS